MCKRMCKRIYKLIKKYDSIVIARHVGPDPDALGSQLGLKESILATFPNKKVYAVGHPASRFKYIGDLDLNIVCHVNDNSNQLSLEL